MGKGLFLALTVTQPGLKQPDGFADSPDTEHCAASRLPCSYSCLSVSIILNTCP